MVQVGNGPREGSKGTEKEGGARGVLLQLRSLYPGQLSGFRRALHSTATSRSATRPPPCLRSGRPAPELQLSQPLARSSHAEAARWAGRGGASPAAWPRPRGPAPERPRPPRSSSEPGAAPFPPRPSFAPPLSAKRRGAHLVHRPSFGCLSEALHRIDPTLRLRLSELWGHGSDTPKVLQFLPNSHVGFLLAQHGLDRV